METAQSIMDKVINNLQKIHVAGVSEQLLMINAIEVLEKLKGMMTLEIVEEDGENDEDQSGKS
ncbi:MAG: hypothetical protein SOY94_01305 [Candidatus Limiplasma sp.]|nr:hypothetical protein [Candidatus Limiplasma sp.]